MYKHELLFLKIEVESRRWEKVDDGRGFLEYDSTPEKLCTPAYSFSS